MAEEKPKESLPKWGEIFVAHIEQIELIIESLGRLFISIQKLFFALKKLWFTLGGSSIFLFLSEKFDWQVLSTVIN